MLTLDPLLRDAINQEGKTPSWFLTPIKSQARNGEQMSSVHPFAPGIFSPFSLLQQKDREDGRTSFFFFSHLLQREVTFQREKNFRKTVRQGWLLGARIGHYQQVSLWMGDVQRPPVTFSPYSFFVRKMTWLNTFASTCSGLESWLSTGDRWSPSSRSIESTKRFHHLNQGFMSLNRKIQSSMRNHTHTKGKRTSYGFILNKMNPYQSPRAAWLKSSVKNAGKEV